MSRILPKYVLAIVVGLAFVFCCADSESASPESVKSGYVKGPTHDKVIIFVHGVLGNGLSTWRKNEKAPSWPELIHQDNDLQEFDIYLVSYLSPHFSRASTIVEIANRELRKLKDNGVFRRHQQIYFVTHSMGGIIAKQMLTSLNRASFTDIKNLDRVRAVIYLSTPAQGSSIAEIASWITANPQLKGMEPADLNTYLQGLEDSWTDFLIDREQLRVDTPKSFCAYETLPTDKVMIVNRVYANTRCDIKPYPIDVDHRDIACPLSAGDDPYPWVKTRILETKTLPDADRMTGLMAGRIKSGGESISQPSDRAKQVANQIPPSADPLTLAQKAMAEGRFNDARRWLNEAEKANQGKRENKKMSRAFSYDSLLVSSRAVTAVDELQGSSRDLAKVYLTYGQVERLAGNYTDSTRWYQKALRLSPDDPDILHETGIAFYLTGSYGEAKTLLKQAIRSAQNKFGSEHRRTNQYTNSLADLYLTVGEYSEAEGLYNETLERDDNILGNEHLDVGKALHGLANLYRTQAKYTKAESYYKRALDLGQKLLGPEHPDVATILNDLSDLHRINARYRKAEELLQQALNIQQKSLGKDHPDNAMTLDVLGDLSLDKAKYNEADDFYGRSFSIREKALGQAHADVGKSLYNLGRLYEQTGKYSESEAYFQRAIAIQQKAFGPDHFLVATTFNELGALYWDMAKYSEAEILHKRCISIARKAFGPKHPDVGDCLGNLGGLYYYQAKYSEGERLMKEGLSILEQTYGPDHPSIAESLHNIATIYDAIGKSEDAEQLYKKSESMKEKLFGSNHPSLALTLRFHASLYFHVGKLAEAETLLNRALKIQTQILGKNHPQVAFTLHSLGQIYSAYSDEEKAEEVYKEAIVITEKALGKESLELDSALSDLASLYQSQGKYGEAEQMFKRALALQKKYGSLKSDRKAGVLLALAVFYTQREGYAQAEPLYLEALDNYEATLGPNHPSVANALGHYASLLRQTGRAAKAEALEGRARAIKKALGQTPKGDGAI